MINNDKLLRHFWGDEVIDDTWGLRLGKTFQEKEYIVIMSLLKKKVMEMENGRQSQGLKELTKFFRNIEWKGLMDMNTLQHLKNGEIYYEENNGYSTDEIDESKTESKIMEVVENG